jgi:hypothetical protein
MYGFAYLKITKPQIPKLMLNDITQISMYGFAYLKITKPKIPKLMLNAMTTQTESIL